MKLHKLTIEGFRKIKSAEVLFEDATFLIGENNVGKSTVLKVLDIFLNDQQKLSDDDFSRENNEDGEEVSSTDIVTLTVEFRNVSEELTQERGFKRERLIKYTPLDPENDTGLSIIYRKTYTKGGSKPKYEMQYIKTSKKDEYVNCKKPQDYIDKGIDRAIMETLFPSINKVIPATEEYKLENIDEIWNYAESETEWFENPGGLQANIMCKLPRFLFIPAEDKSTEIDSEKGCLVSILQELFKEVRDRSDNYIKAQAYLNALSLELNPNDNATEFGSMMTELNQVIGDVFPIARFNAISNLSDPDKVIKPSFDISLTSNVKTPISYQGTGMVRAAVFALLRYRKQREERIAGANNRGVIIGFEEPEIYLHPNAANKMRDTIYELASGNSQIICTTHSPYMIDLSKKQRQILNHFKTIEKEFSSIEAFSVSEAFVKLQNEEKDYIKMVQKIDDYVARIFFAKRIIIVEGNTEEIVLKRTIELMPEIEKSKIASDFQIVKAVGKPVIISLVKYLKAMNIEPFVVHDEDQGKDGAERFNSNILEALGGDENKRLLMHNCIEEELGYAAPTSDKPYVAYKKTQEWQSWTDIPDNWRNKMKIVFSGYLNE